MQTEVLVIGAGGAGMYAALSAARAGAEVLLLDRSLVGRGGATVMAQMTVAAAIGHAEADDWRSHFDDTLAAARGLADETLARILCEDAPARILEMADWHVGWASDGNRIRQVMAPGHSAARCVYVDFLNTGPAVSRTLRTQLNRADRVRRASDLSVDDIVLCDGRAAGAIARHLPSGAPISISAGATIIATGGLTRLYQRNSASLNMSGDGFALALRAGAELVDMEFVQFFPIGHLAPRLIGMDPIMWDPFRYKLGGRLLNSEGREITEEYGVSEDGTYVATRDVATYAIVKEVEAGRGSPHGGAYLSFEHISEAALKEAFGPVIDRLAANGIDLTEMPIEVAPIAHYHMGGIVVDARLQSRVPGLFAAGEVVGGPAGANRLSGNAISEALVFGERAGRFAAEEVRSATHRWDEAEVSALLEAARAPGTADPRDAKNNSAARIVDLQALMGRHVGPFRTEAGLDAALTWIAEERRRIADLKPQPSGGFDPLLIDWHDYANMLVVAESIALSARAREESRGAHQRDDFVQTDPAWRCNQRISLESGDLRLTRHAVADPRAQEIVS